MFVKETYRFAWHFGKHTVIVCYAKLADTKRMGNQNVRQSNSRKNQLKLWSFGVRRLCVKTPERCYAVKFVLK